MVERKASVFICDEILASLTGKFTISGMYTTDLIVPDGGLSVPQLVFLFTVETPKDAPFQSLSLKVKLPGEDAPRQLTFPAPQLSAAGFSDPRRTTAIYRLPFLVQQINLQPGRIECTISHESGELEAGGLWVSTASAAQAAAQEAAKAAIEAAVRAFTPAKT